MRNRNKFSSNAAERVRTTKKEEDRLNIFGRQIIRFCGPVRVGEDMYRKMYNREVEETLNVETIVRKIERIKWLGLINKRK